MNCRELDINKKILVTGAAGFIGYHLTRALLEAGCAVAGFDNLNSYYEVGLKEDRLRILKESDRFRFIRGDLADREALERVFVQEKPDIVVNLGAQAGVRNSIDHPDAYIQSNIIGFYNVLECCRHYPVDHLVFASSSSVYGSNKKIPFSTEDKADCPVSLYAATKRSDELMAHCYSKLYDIPATGLRFFTVYGPLGRPDMAYFSFANRIMAGEPIRVFNQGDMYRDFTYIDDIVYGMKNILNNPPAENECGARYKIYNIGNNKPVKLMDFIETLERCLGKKAEKEFCPMQPGDVYQTYADVTDLMEDFGFKPDTDIETGLTRFAEWYREYYHI
ncbi:MAG: GDP-mannose 4,6-dehydratase [Clostridiales bacterium]|nr:GDP-mannose 4,6-dehydratase [Clostridiales bacterium]